MAYFVAKIHQLTKCKSEVTSSFSKPTYKFFSTVAYFLENAKLIYLELFLNSSFFLSRFCNSSLLMPCGNLKKKLYNVTGLQ